MRISQWKIRILGGCASALALAACGAAPNATQQGSVVVAQSAPATANQPASKGALGIATGAVPSTVAAAIDNSSIANVVVVVGNGDGELYRYQKGSNDFKSQTLVASGGKLLLGVLAMRMVQANKVSLTAPASTYFSYWAPPSGSDDRRTETLRYLLAQTGGFNHGILVNGCADNGSYTLQNCAHQIYNSGLENAAPEGKHYPGTVFSYGAQDLQLGAALLEAAGGGPTFNTLMRTYVTGSGALNMPNTEYKNTLLQTPNPTNPYVAKNLWSTTDDYAKLLTALLHGQFITDLDQLFEARTTTSQKLGFVPPSIDDDGDWQYAQASWVVCHDKPKNDPTRKTFAELGCAANKVNSSPGLYGWTPWIDRVHGYWALIAMNQTQPEGDTVAVPLQRALEPLIVANLGI